jgi:hypothetical protein
MKAPMGTLKILKIKVGNSPAKAENFGTLFVHDKGNNPWILFKQHDHQEPVRCTLTVTKETCPTPGLRFTGKQVQTTSALASHLFFRNEETGKWSYVVTDNKALRIQNSKLSAWFDSLVA